MSHLVELGQFLRSRRSAVLPVDAGLPTDARRRVAGLRREEVALLAGVSVDYYVRLEQGRAANPSAQVLDAVAAALRMTEVERSHLNRLAQPGRPAARAADRGGGRAGAGSRPQLRALLDAMPGVAAYVLDPSMDVLDANDLARRLFLFEPAAARPNIARAVFLAPSARTFWVHWDRVARDCVGFMRLSLGQRRGDARLRRVIGELSVASADFARLWALQQVRQKSHGAKTVNHPVVGSLTLNYETFLLPDDSGQALITYVADDRRSADGLAILLST